MFHDPQFWVFIAFIIFIVLIFKPVKKLLISNLDIKINEIKNKINEAEKLKKEAQKALSEIKKRQNDLKKEILIIEENARNKIHLIEKEHTQKLNDQIHKRQNLSKIKIDQIARDANSEIQQYISESVIIVVRNIIEKKLDPYLKEQLIDNSIDEIKTILKN